MGLVEYGYMIHKMRARNKASMGEKMKGRVLANIGVLSSFVKSFNASAIGWGMPDKLTLFGPLRNWMYPRIFRSKRVKNAIANNIQIKIIKMVGMALIYIVLG